MNPLRRKAGFSLIELMVVVAVLAIIVTIAAPNLHTFLDKNRVVGAAEAIYSQVQLARSEAVKQSASMEMVFSDTTAWCSGFSRQGTVPCDCTDGLDGDAPCSILADGQTMVLKVLRSADYRGVTMVDGATASIVFDGVRGTTGTDGNVTLQSEMGRQMQVEINPLGRVRLCSPNGSVGGYPAC